MDISLAVNQTDKIQFQGFAHNVCRRFILFVHIPLLVYRFN